MATISITPVQTVTSIGMNATITGIDPSTVNFLVGEIHPANGPSKQVYWDKGGRCMGHADSLNLDCRREEVSQTLHAAQRILSAELPATAEVRVRNAEADCPHCGHTNDGWMVDPRGKIDECDKCKKPYRIAENANIKLF